MSLEPSVYALAPVGGTALIILFSSCQTWVTRLLSAKVFVGIGLISYSAYLWHQPLFAFAHLRSLDEPSQNLMIALVVFSLVLAWTTWRWVELPFRSGAKFSIERRNVFLLSFSAAVTLLFIGVAGYSQNGVPSRFNERQIGLLKYENYPSHNSYNDGVCFLRPEQRFDSFKNSCFNGKDIYLMGDSHAAALSSYLSEKYNVAEIAASGCPALKDFMVSWRPNCKDINDFRFSLVEKYSPKIVILHANWHLYWSDVDIAAQLRNTIDFLKVHNVTVLVIGGVPQFQPNATTVAIKSETPVSPGTLAKSTAHNDLMRENNILQKVSIEEGALFWNPLTNNCDAHSNCVIFVDNSERGWSNLDAALLVWDYGHLTFSGAKYLGEQLVTNTPSIKWNN